MPRRDEDEDDERDNPEHEDLIEHIIDETSLQDVVDYLVSIAEGKADHIRSSYDDEPLARSWERDARRLAKIQIEN